MPWEPAPSRRGRPRRRESNRTVASQSRTIDPIPRHAADSSGNFNPTQGEEPLLKDDEEDLLDKQNGAGVSGQSGLPGQLLEGSFDFVEDPPAHWTQQQRRKKPKALAKPDLPRGPLTPQQQLRLLDTWMRSGVPARDFAACPEV